MENTTLSLRDRSEVQRSSLEAQHTVLKPANPAQVARYLAPPSTTPFSLEYAFYLLGDVAGKAVLDLGCGTGENLVPLIKRGAHTIGVDISPDLIRLAQRRVNDAEAESEVRVGSAYATGLPDDSIDVIFCMSLIHHLEIARVRDEMRRILKPGGHIVLKEPVRFSPTYSRLRKLLPSKQDISEYEHPLTEQELSTMTEPFQVEGKRFFRLPMMSLAHLIHPSISHSLSMTDYRLLKRYPALERYATVVVMRLIK
jgi:SAM-dependent methyltransferase